MLIVHNSDDDASNTSPAQLLSVDRTHDCSSIICITTSSVVLCVG